jgi:prepilin-type N-terminal cleavage/methylation domain-containing protein
MRAGVKPRRRARSGQSGFTLVELLVSVIILALIGVSIAAAFTVGFHVLGNRGDQVALAGSNDVLAFEQQLGRDIARADCLAASGQTTIPIYATGVRGCQHSVNNSPTVCQPSGYQLCLSWYLPGSKPCHTITYKGGSGFVNRVDTLVDPLTGTTTKNTQISTGDLSLSASWTPTATATSGNTWTTLVSVQVTQLLAGARNPVSTTFRVVPMVDDPLAFPPGSVTPPC